jgi:hypothetical protein
MGGSAEGVATGKGHVVRRGLEAAAEIWRERASEKRARATAAIGPSPRVARSRLAAAVQAWLAVRSGVRCDDFLRQRLAKYAGRLPVPLEALPVTFDIEAGEAVVRPRPRARALHGARPEAAPFARALVEREGAYAGREIRDAEGALDALDARAAAARDRLEGVERELSQALASGGIVPRPSVDATAEQLGRPPVPAGLPIHALRAFVAALVAAEAWRFSGPALAAAGLPADAIEHALRTAPVAAGLALGLALGTAAAAFTFAGAALSRAAAAAGSASDPARRRLAFAAALGAALLVPAIAAAAATPERWAHLALLAAVPFAGAMLWRTAAALTARRAAAAEAALAWDRARAAEAVERGRREEVCARAAAELHAIEAQRAAARRKVQQLHRLAVAAERSAALAERAEAGRLERLSEGLACALELDRYLYVRLAAERVEVQVERPARAARLERALGGEHLGVAG